ncbi:complement component C9 [Orycteropus afer afer]|uniref:Complement component C9 n=1 Tax=Orycteropus afer afer TaxID=1230840 RepID=A0A8B7AU10_ORYAF|nr:complement component C9 [Orycteropus afer afer]
MVDIIALVLGPLREIRINILGMDPLSTPFDNEFYNGICERVRDGNTLTYYRKPWNLASLSYEVKADKNMRTEHFERQFQAFTNIIQEKRSTFNVDLSLKFIPTETIKDLKNTIKGKDNGKSTTKQENKKNSFHFHYSKNESYQQFLSYFSEKEKIFLLVKGMVQMGTFVMKSRSVMLTTSFMDDIKALPTTYEKGEYFAFLETYGTHYSSSGSLGGLYELIYVLDKANMKEKGVEIIDIKRCLGFNLDLSISIANIGAEITQKVNKDSCLKRGEGRFVNITQDNLIDDVFSFIRGGNKNYVLELKEKLLRGAKTIDVTDFVNWASSLSDAPVLISQKLSPIYNLIPVQIKDAHRKKQNLEQAIEDYINEFNVRKCHPCQNGGTVVLLNGQCLCTCPKKFEGTACEIIKGQIL